jgi:hypothetical protein
MASSVADLAGSFDAVLYGNFGAKLKWRVADLASSGFDVVMAQVMQPASGEGDERLDDGQPTNHASTCGDGEQLRCLVTQVIHAALSEGGKRRLMGNRRCPCGVDERLKETVGMGDAVAHEGYYMVAQAHRASLSFTSAALCC